MPRPRNSTPDLKQHAKGQFFIRLHGQQIYLGTNRRAAEAERLRIIGRSIAMPDVPPTAGPGMLLADALLLYAQHAAQRYTDERQLTRIRIITVKATERFPTLLATEFRARALEELRAHLVTCRRDDGRPLTRRYINHLIAALVIGFRWLATREVVPMDTFHLLREQARDLCEWGGGRDSDPIVAVEDKVVDRTLEAGSDVVRAMIQVQRLAGMRPGELVRMRREEISTRPGEWVRVAVTGKMVQAVNLNGKAFWLYAPAKHKNLKRKKPRTIVLNPEAQRILSPFLAGLDPVRGGPVFRRPNGEPFTVGMYGHKIMRAVWTVNRREVREGRALVAGRLIPSWSPNQLRKAAAEEADKHLGADAAGALLGHGAGRRALDTYIQQQVEQAVRAADKLG